MITDEELHRKLHGLNQFISGTSECEDYLFTYQELKSMVSELIQRREEKREREEVWANAVKNGRAVGAWIDSMEQRP
jgi:hypothetical protein